MTFALAGTPTAETEDSGGHDDTAPPAEECQEKAKDLKNDFEALEHFLRDKETYKKQCPYLEWAQPPIETYKEEPKSYLPPACTAEKI